jgi:hypothetical protein
METIMTAKGIALTFFTFIGFFSMLYPPLYHFWSDVKKQRHGERR